MAFKDGMYAIAKVLKVVAVVLAGASLVAGALGGGFILGSFIAAGLFLMFWTPAWVIKKFFQ